MKRKRQRKSDWVDLKKIKEQVSLKQVLERYGVWETLEEVRPGQYRGPCPLSTHSPDDDEHTFVVTLTPPPQRWACHSKACREKRLDITLGKAGGNMLDFVCLYEDLPDQLAAGKFLQEQLLESNTGRDCKQTGKQPRPEPEDKVLAAPTDTREHEADREEISNT